MHKMYSDSGATDVNMKNKYSIKFELRMKIVNEMGPWFLNAMSHDVLWSVASTIHRPESASVW